MSENLHLRPDAGQMELPVLIFFPASTAATQEYMFLSVGDMNAAGRFNTRCLAGMACSK